VVGAWVVLAIVGARGARELRVEANLEALLPDDTPSLVALDAMRERVEVRAPFFVLVESGDPALNRELAAQVRDGIAAWPETRWVTDRRDPSVFVEHRLLYLPTGTLEELADDVEARVRWESCALVPGCVNFTDPVELPTEADLRAAFAAEPGNAELLQLFGDEATLGEPSPDDAPPGQLCSPDGRVCMVTASLEGDPGRVSHAERILERGERLLRAVTPADAPADLRMEVGGRYRNVPLVKRLTEVDLSATGILSTVLVLLLVLVQFRGVRSVVALALPLGGAIVVTLGALGWAGIALNLISAFTLAVLAGIGIDFGLHLLTHYGEQRAEGADPEAALASAMGALGRSLLVAGATTAAAFLALAAARFAGFAQMGWVASLGVVVALVAYLTFFPALLLVLHQLWPEKRALFRRSPLERMPQPSRRMARWVALGGVALIAAAVPFALRLDFEYRFHRLQPAGVANGILRGDAERGPTGTAVYLLADDPADLDDLHAVRASRLGGQAPVVITPRTLVPQDQGAKLAALARIRAAIERVDGRLDEDARARLAPLRPALVTEPLTADSLPPWAADHVGSGGHALGVAYVPVRGSDAHQMEALAGELERWRAAHPAVVFASPEAVLGEVVPALRSDAPRVVLLALLGLGLAVALIGRSVRRLLLVLAPVAAAVVVGLGLAVLLDLRLNLYNTLVLPVAFGVGVDGAIYVVWALGGDGPIDERWRRFTTSARAIVGSTATTLAAFGSILVAKNPGLASIGSLALITIGFTLLANVVWLPAVMLGWARAPASRSVVGAQAADGDAGDHVVHRVAEGGA